MAKLKLHEVHAPIVLRMAYPSGLTLPFLEVKLAWAGCEARCGVAGRISILAVECEPLAYLLLKGLVTECGSRTSSIHQHLRNRQTNPLSALEKLLTIYRCGDGYSACRAGIHVTEMIRHKLDPEENKSSLLVYEVTSPLLTFWHQDWPQWCPDWWICRS